MQTHKSNGGKPIYKEWHERRQRAREESFTDEDFPESERTDFNLRNDDRLYPARIYGDEHPMTYMVEGPDGELHDIRDLDDR